MGLGLALWHPDLETFACPDSQDLPEEDNGILVAIFLPHQDLVITLRLAKNFPGGISLRW